MKRNILLLLFFLTSSYCAVASHIVGAELYYDYQGNNNYLITLKLYRNCGCDSCADYSPIEYVQIFDSSGNFISAIPMPRPPRDTFPDITKPCQQPIDVCIELAVYTCTTSLAPRPGGYTLVYQRCCRNNSIQSIPNNSGATYVAHISNDRVTNNSSPRFTQLPPIFICAGQYLLFDNSAIDPDGDSLAYSLVNALDGASQTCTDPSPNSAGIPACGNLQASPPPYTSVIYLSPYSAGNPTNSPPTSGDLQIDPTTGLLTGTPNQTGIFVVAVAVSEYRHGVYLGQTIRDYQFNIVTCTNPTANLIYVPGSYNPSLGMGVYTYECSSHTVNFNNDSFYNPPPTNTAFLYHWDFGVTTLTNDTSDQRNPVYTYPDTGTYYVTISVAKFIPGSGWCYDTSRGIVIIYPFLGSDFSFVNACQDSSETFLDGSISTTSPLSHWRWDFGDGDTSILRNPLHHYSAGGEYLVSLKVTNQKGCTDIKSDSVTVFPQTALSFTHPPLCVFDSLTFTYTGTGPATSFFWDLGNGSTSTAVSPTTYYGTAGTFPVSLMTVTDHGCRDTLVQQLTVHPLPTITTSPSVTICPYTTTQLSASGAATYVWTPAASLNNDSISNPVASPITSTIYQVTGKDINGCVSQNFLLISVYPIPQIDAGPDTSVCLTAGSFRDSVQLHATGGVSYIWSPATGLSSTTIPDPVSRPTTNQTYYVVGADTNGCHITDSVTVFVLDPLLNLIIDTSKAICDHDTTTLTVLRQGDSYYLWTPNTGISDPTSNSPYFYPDTTTTYYFTVRNYCYQKSDTATIIVHPLPAITTEHVDSVCTGDTVRLYASGASVYQWQADPTLSSLVVPDPLARPTATDVYYVTAIDTVYGCKKTDSILVYDYPLPVPGIGPDTSFICQGKPVQLVATGGVDYIWTADPSLSSLTVGNPIAIPADTIIYHVRVYNVHQCHADTSIQIDVQLPVTAVALPAYDICVGLTVQLSSSGGFYYLWTPNKWLSNPNISNPVAKPDSSIVYTVRVSNDCFSSTASVDVTIHPLPILNAGDDTTIFRNTSATLEGTTDGQNSYWSPATDLADPTSLSTAASPLYTTIYYLYSTSEYGCTNLDSVKVTVESFVLVLLPTAFSPNGDGVNDVFHISEHLNIMTLQEFAVYDRWGQKVFSTSSLTQGWDGTYDGRPQDMGTYVWYVNAVTYDKQQITQSGNVTLLR